MFPPFFRMILVIVQPWSTNHNEKKTSQSIDTKNFNDLNPLKAGGDMNEYFRREISPPDYFVHPSINPFQ